MYNLPRKKGYSYFIPKVTGVLCGFATVLLLINGFMYWYAIGIVSLLIFFLPEIIGWLHGDNYSSPPPDWYK